MNSLKNLTLIKNLVIILMFAGLGDGYSGSANILFPSSPLITNISPLQNEISVNKSSDITVTFDQDMNTTTINNSNLKVNGSLTGFMNCAVSYDASQKKAVINPDNDFKTGEVITVTIKSGIKNLSGDSIKSMSYSFTVAIIHGAGIFSESRLLPDIITNAPFAQYIITGDIDGDSDIDLLAIMRIPNIAFDGIAIYKRQSDGSYEISSGFYTQFHPETTILNLELKDMDNDGDLDAVGAIGNGIAPIIIFIAYNDGTGFFTMESINPPFQDLIIPNLTADFDNDGDIDIVNINSYNSLQVYSNIGNRLFSIIDLYQNFEYTSINICNDFDNDGDIDIINESKVLVNNGNFSFSVLADIIPNGFTGVMKDFDNDGDLDIITSNSSQIYLHRNNGHGIFSNSSLITSANYSFTNIAEDFNADGSFDLLLFNSLNSKYEIFQNTGTGNFTYFSTLDYPEFTPYFCNDIDSDGDVDIIGKKQNRFYNLLNCSSPVCSISGDSVIGTGSVNNIYTGSAPNGYWDISNYENTQASIPPNSTGDSVIVNAGLNGGHFALYFIIPDGCGGYPSCIKHVYVEDPVVPEIISLSPLQNEVSASNSGDINIQFSEDLNSATVNSSNIKINGSQTGNIHSVISYISSGKKIKINPDIDFKPGEEITVILNSQIRSIAGATVKSFQFKFTAATALAAGMFSEVQTGIGANKFAAGDIDGDGDLDLMTNNDFSLRVNKNNGSGSFTQYSSIGHNISDSRFMLSDMDGDNDIDIILNNSNGTMSLYNNNGNGDFTSALNLTGIPGNIKDMDNDGDPDIVYFGNIINWNLPVTILKNNGGSFSGDTTSINMFCSGSAPFFGKLDAEDFDNDGDIDIAAGGTFFDFTLHFLWGSLKIKKNDGNGLFPAVFEYCYPIDEGIPHGLVYGSTAINYDGDNDIDFLYYPNFNFNNNGSGNFSLNLISNNPYPVYPVTGDYDGDGDLDAFGSNGSNYILYKNNAGTFYKDSNNSLPIDNNSVSGDFDNDGDLDIINLKNGIVKLYLNQPQIINANITAVIEGFYDLNLNKLNIRDTLTAYLRNVNSPFNIVDSSKALIDSVTFTGNFTFTNAPAGTYYIHLKHRNSLETWSKTGGETFTAGGNLNYDFTTSASQSYGNNSALKGSRYCIFSGDVNQDGIIDLNDLGIIDNEVRSYTSGYLTADLNGDGIADIGDMSIADNNSRGYVTVRNPIVGDGMESKLSKESKEKSKESEINKSDSDIPDRFELKDNYPNPFNPTTKINYSLPKAGNVSLKILTLPEGKLSHY